MNLRWLWLDHFPPGMELTVEQRVAAMKRAREHRKQEQNYRGTALQTMRVYVFMVVPLTVLFVLWVFALISWRLGVVWYVASLVTGILVFNGLIWLCLALSMYRTRGPYVRKALNDMNLPVCVDCGYILAGIGENEQCPECGAKREPLEVKQQ